MHLQPLAAANELDTKGLPPYTPETVGIHRLPTASSTSANPSIFTTACQPVLLVTVSRPPCLTKPI